MKNPATNPDVERFNVFTQFLYNEIQQGRTPMVLLRDGRYVPISWFDQDGSEYEYFTYRNPEQGVYLIWNEDGTSIHSKRFDMMELYEGS